MTSSGIVFVIFYFGVRVSIKAELLRSSCPLVLEGIFDQGADMLQLRTCRIPGIFTGANRTLVRLNMRVYPALGVSPA